MFEKTVSDRIWEDHYYDCRYGADKPDIPGRDEPWLEIEKGLPRLRVLTARQHSSPERNTDGYFVSTTVCVWLYIFVAGEYTDPYITYYVPQDHQMSYREMDERVRAVKIQASKDGTITITSYDGQEKQYSLPVPSDERESSIRRY